MTQACKSTHASILTQAFDAQNMQIDASMIFGAQNMQIDASMIFEIDASMMFESRKDDF